MSEGLNKVFLIGRLGKDPELKTVGNNLQRCSFSVATSEYGGRENPEKTEWHNVVVWGRQADACSRFLSKGRLVHIEGRIQTQMWIDQATQQKRYKTEIVAQHITFLGDKGGATTGSVNSGRYANDDDYGSDKPQREKTPEELAEIQAGLRGVIKTIEQKFSAVDADAEKKTFGSDDDVPF